MKIQPLLLTSHCLPSDYSITQPRNNTIGKMHKVSGLSLCNFYPNFRLTKCGGCGIIVNSTRIVHTRAAKIKKSQYFNWLHSPTHFREHSVALLSRPNVHDLWRVRFRNFLTCGFYLGGLLISFTSFLCFNYSTSWLLCQHFFIFYDDYSM